MCHCWASTLTRDYLGGHTSSTLPRDHSSVWGPCSRFVVTFLLRSFSRSMSARYVPAWSTVRISGGVRDRFICLTGSRPRPVVWWVLTCFSILLILCRFTEQMPPFLCSINIF